MPEKVISTAKGRVVTGFSKPYVALYNYSEGAISYTSGQELARGVSVDFSVESSDVNNFYANNVESESTSGEFTSGTVDLGVDGLLTASERLIMGIPAAGEDGFSTYDDDQSIPYVGIGYITRYMSGGAVSYEPTVIVKAKFDQIPRKANTQEDAIDWQTNNLTAKIYRSEAAKHPWLHVGGEYATEAEAEAALKTKLGIVGA